MDKRKNPILYSVILSLCCCLIQPMWKPEGGNILSPRQLTVQRASQQRTWKNGDEATGFGTTELFSLSSGAWYFPDAPQPSATLTKKKGVDYLYPPQLSCLFSLLLNYVDPPMLASRCCCHGSPRGWCTAHPPRAALLQEVRDFLAWNTAGLFCSHHGESVYLDVCSSFVTKPLYAQCLFIPALNQSWVKNLQGKHKSLTMFFF